MVRLRDLVSEGQKQTLVKLDGSEIQGEVVMVGIKERTRCRICYFFVSYDRPLKDGPIRLYQSGKYETTQVGDKLIEKRR